jgi:hypothetical protein
MAQTDFSKAEMIDLDEAHSVEFQVDATGFLTKGEFLPGELPG